MVLTTGPSLDVMPNPCPKRAQCRAQSTGNSRHVAVNGGQ
jgi:hypothetical protein